MIIHIDVKLLGGSVLKEVNPTVPTKETFFLELSRVSIASSKHNGHGRALRYVISSC